MLKFIMFIAAVGVATPSATAYAADSAFVRTDRYTLVSTAVPREQIEPLAAIVTMTFGPDVVTIADALDTLLLGSGYRWRTPNAPLDASASGSTAPGSTGDRIFNRLPLPAVNRTMGPMSLTDALTAVAGRAWRLESDPVERTVWFELE